MRELSQFESLELLWVIFMAVMLTVAILLDKKKVLDIDVEAGYRIYVVICLGIIVLKVLTKC